MSNVAPRLATYQDLLGLPEDVWAEILSGRVVTAPSPLPKHSRAQRALGRFIGGPFDDDDGGGPGGWWNFVEVVPSTRLTRRVRSRRASVKEPSAFRDY